MALLRKKLAELQEDLIERWMRRIDSAREKKQPFRTIGDQCYAFYAKDCGHMWTTEFKNKFIGESVQAPQFQVTTNLTWEYVGLIGPHLFWGNPQATIRPVQPLELDPMAFGDPENPEVQQMFAAVQAEQQQFMAAASLTSQLMERVLNYGNREQYCNLGMEGQFAVIEAMIRGMGCLWIEEYQFPGSDRKLVGAFWDSCNNLFVDPDCVDPTWKSSKWIVRRRYNTPYDLEKRFGLKRGTLKQYASIHSNESAVNRNSGRSERERKEGRDGTLIEWYEVFSRFGVGIRDCEDLPDEDLAYDLDEIVGDFAYMCVAKNVPFLLNAPPEVLDKEKEDNDAVMERLSWPVLSHYENQYPVCRLQFNIDPESAYPIPPLGAAIGELVCINILVSCYIEKTYASRKTIIAYLQSAAQQIEKAMSQNSPDGFVRLPLNDVVQKSVNDVIQFLNQPGNSGDILEAIGYMTQAFYRRTGLNELMYGASATQERSAAAIHEKSSRSQVRPDKMSQDVAKWMSEVMRLLKFHAAVTITGEDVKPLVGAGGALLWEQFISSRDPEEVARCMDATVEASDVRKPDKLRDAENMRQLLPMLLPVMQQYAYVKGNDPAGVSPLNNLLKLFGSTIEQPMDSLQLGPFAPPPPDEEMAMMQMQLQQLQTEGVAADVDLKRAQAAKTAAEAEQVGTEGQKRQMEFQFDVASKEMDLQAQQQKANIDMQVKMMEAKLKEIQGRQKIGADAAKFMFQGAQMRQAAAERQMARESAE